MSGFRIAQGGLVDCSKVLSFSFDGKTFSGFEGDTLASALIANGVRVMGRSFKYHRPRGVWGSWFDDPNATFNVRLNGNELTNCAATTTALVEGMQARAGNAYPSAQNDIKGALDKFHRFMPAGFYYKMFMWPDWHLFEPMIRTMAGLGYLDGQEIEGDQGDQIHDAYDLLVVGGGPAGLAAAREAAEAGQTVVLIDDHPRAGGSAWQLAQIDGVETREWVESTCEAIKTSGGRIVLNATAFGLYDHQLVAVAEDRGFGNAPRLTRMRAALWQRARLTAPLPLPIMTALVCCRFRGLLIISRGTAFLPGETWL